MAKDTKAIVNFFFEVGSLAQTPRSGFSFLGSGRQSVAEHITRTVYIGYTLGMLEKDIDTAKVMMLCQFHDLAEARTSDLAYVHQKYVIADEEKAIKDLIKSLPFGAHILELLTEHKERTTKEAILAKEADILELLLSLKEQIDVGNKRAETWVKPVIMRLKTENAKELANVILETNSDDWWYENKEDKWWVERNKKTVKKRF